MSAHDDYLDQRAGNSGPGNGPHECSYCGGPESTEECGCHPPDTKELFDPIPERLAWELEASLMQLKELTPLTDQGIRTIRALLRRVYAHGRSDALVAAAINPSGVKHS
jgi:hypothetical protein